jgi:elongation factor 1 alpha-like protein
VDAGKSTLNGHLLYLLGAVDKKTMHKNEKESKQIGKGSFAFAWLLDGHEEERERGVTIDVGVKHVKTQNRRLQLLDAPGQKLMCCYCVATVLLLCC